MSFVKRLYYFLRTNLSETISLVIAIAGSLIAYWLSQKQGLLLLASLMLALTLYLMILVAKRFGKDFYFILFRDDRDIKDWIGNGTFTYYPKGNGFLIKETEAGFLYSKCFGWVDYELSLDFKILNNCLGVIVRAIDSSNYVMLQIRKDGIRPHVRVNGGWVIKEAIESGLVYEKPFQDGSWYKLVVNVKNNVINIKITNKSKTVLFDRNWDILSGIISLPIRDKDDKEKFIGMLDSHLNCVYGTVGLRNSTAEQALIRNMLIKKT